MKTLIEIYSDLLSKPEKWCYYETMIDDFNQKNFTNEIFTSDKEAYRFIKWYFDIGGKDSLLKSIERNGRIHFNKNRAIHTVSTFFLGIYITNSFKIDIHSKNELNMNFKYYWFLICLFHDVGYVYEKDFQCKRLQITAQEGLAGLQRILHLRYFGGDCYLTYSRKVINEYLKKRAQCQKEGENIKAGKIDHGIAGGLLIYNELHKMFETSWENRNYLNSFYRDDFHIDNNGRELHVSSKHFPVYAQIADAIMAHNIWLTNLPERHEFRISQNNQYLFILALADTIEPLKRELDFVDSIAMKSNHDGEIEIIVPNWQDSKKSKQVVDSVLTMKDWIQVNVEKSNLNNTVDMHIKITVV